MSKELEYLIELARKCEVTAADREEQVRSFAFGNTHFENETITRADIDEAAESLRSNSEPTVRP